MRGDACDREPLVLHLARHVPVAGGDHVDVVSVGEQRAHAVADEAARIVARVARKRRRDEADVHDGAVTPAVSSTVTGAGAPAVAGAPVHRARNRRTAPRSNNHAIGSTTRIGRRPDRQLGP